MLEKARNNTSDIGLLDARYTIDKFHNPYLSKFTFKLTPSTVNNHQSQQRSYLISPFNPTNSLYISQSLPIFKSQKFRASLVWKQSMKRKMARGFIGLSTQYKTEDLWSLRCRAMFGCVFLYNLEAIKKISNDTEVILYHHGMYDNKVIAPLFGIGGRKKQFSATFHHRLGLDYNAVLQYTKPLSHGFYMYERNELTVGQKFELESKTFTSMLSLDYYFDQTIRARAGVSHTLEDNQIRPVFEVEKSVESWGNFSLSLQYRNNASILSISYKNPTLNFVLPVLLVDSPIPAVVSAFLYVVGYLARKKFTPIFETKKKQDDIRMNELKLISDKANAIYQKQRTSGENGLLIDWAFVGPAELINQIQATPENRRLALMRDNDFKQNLFDVTVSLRFYVIKGELKLKKGDKNHLLGFYCRNSDDEVFLKYKKGNVEREVRYKMMDDMLIN